MMGYFDDLAGREPCGTWVCYAYFKRPLAASIGPEAGIDQPERRPARSAYFGARVYVLLLVALVLVVAVVAAVMTIGDGLVGGGFAAGAATGGVIGAVAIVAVGAFLARRAEARADRESAENDPDWPS